VSGRRVSGDWAGDVRSDGEQARQLVRGDIDEDRDPDMALLQVSGTPSAAWPPGTAAPSEGLAPHTKDASQATGGEGARRLRAGRIRSVGISRELDQVAAPANSHSSSVPRVQIATLATPARGDSSAFVTAVRAGIDVVVNAFPGRRRARRRYRRRPSAAAASQAHGSGGSRLPRRLAGLTINNRGLWTTCGPRAASPAAVTSAGSGDLLRRGPLLTVLEATSRTPGRPLTL
jgi:hypothetical protein